MESEEIELQALYDELVSRKGEGRRRRFRIILGKATIAATYGLKRMIDLVGSVGALVCLSPVFAATALAIRLESKGPVFFAQTRVGRDGRHFKFWKFRSMRTDAEALKAKLMQQNESKDGVIFKMKNDPRITKVGRFIRKYSIDELPQLWNVLIGDLSLVGPRPPVPSEVAQYTLEERKRLNVIPGLTCLWQIKGRSDIPFKEQVRLDTEYIRTRGFWSDLKILLKTPAAILSG